MKPRALRVPGLVLLLLATLPATSLAAGRPPLARLTDAYDGNVSEAGPAFQSDGSRYVTFSNSAGAVVALDAQTAARSTVALSPCDTTETPPGVSLVGPGSPSVFHPVSVSQGTLITYCYDGLGSEPEQFRLIDLATGASRLVTFDPPPNDGPYNDLTSPAAAGTDWAQVVGGEPGEIDQGFFDLTSGAVVEPPPLVAATEYYDLDSAQLTHRLCAPVTTANVEDPAAGKLEPIVVTLVGFDRPWVVLEYDTDNFGGSSGASVASAELYAWRCGATKPVALGPVETQREQFGDGIVTWVEPRGSVDAYDLATGRHWTWAPAAPGPNGAKVGYSEALHTASRIYVVPDTTPETSSGPQEIYTASLAGLLRPAPAKRPARPTAKS
jgi:hypothetical protein